MKENQTFVMTSFGLVPFEAIKEFIDPKEVKLIEKFLSKESSVPEDIDYYIKSIAKKKGWSFEKMDSFLEALYGINRGAAFSIILREIAIELDKKYTDHIEHSEKIYGVGLTNGHIFEIDKKHIKNYRHFAAFRTPEDAKTACKILRGLLRDLFKSGK